MVQSVLQQLTHCHGWSTAYLLNSPSPHSSNARFMRADAERGAAKQGKCEGTPAEQERGHRKWNLIETVNKRISVNLCFPPKAVMWAECKCITHIPVISSDICFPFNHIVQITIACFKKQFLFLFGNNTPLPGTSCPIYHLCKNSKANTIKPKRHFKLILGWTIIREPSLVSFFSEHKLLEWWLCCNSIQ